MCKCDNCGKIFNLYKHEGQSFNIMLEKGAIPYTTYICMECIKKQKNKINKEFDDCMKYMRKKYHKYYCK